MNPAKVMLQVHARHAFAVEIIGDAPWELVFIIDAILVTAYMLGGGGD